jgi:hypothetical protein
LIKVVIVEIIGLSKTEDFLIEEADIIGLLVFECIECIPRE